MQNKVLGLVVLALGALLAAAPGRAVERGEIPERYQWDLGSLYADEAAWTAAKDSLK
jgi:hypothetical protein